MSGLTLIWKNCGMIYFLIAIILGVIGAILIGVSGIMETDSTKPPKKPLYITGIVLLSIGLILFIIAMVFSFKKECRQAKWNYKTGKN